MLSDGDGKVEGTGAGNGMIDAAIAAIAQATGVTGTITDFHVSSVTGGGDALGDVVVQLDVDGTKAPAVAASPPTSSRRRPARTSRRSTRSCGSGSARASARRVVGP